MAFQDPNGFNVQISETIDTRDELEARRSAKRQMAEGSDGLFGGIDHISTYCSDFSANRSFYTEILGLEEFFYSNTREEGEVVVTEFEQGAFAVGGTDIELASDETWTDIGPGTIQQLGFSTDDIDHAFKVLRERSVC